MHIWFALLARELLLLALLTALGAGPSAFAPQRFAGAARLAAAPAFGLSVGVCAAVTLVYYFPARETGWIVVALAFASVAAAVWRHGWRWRSPSLATVAQVALVAIVVLVSFDYPLVTHHTAGPVGGYAIGDTSGYVSEIDAEQRQSIRQADRDRPPYTDLSLAAWSIYVQHTQQLDISALEANIDARLGLGATDTQGPFLIAIILVGALGAWAVVRSACGRRTWTATLAGLLFAGPLFVELFMDGSQAAIAGSALLGPIVALGLEALRRPQPATLVLLGLLAAGLQTLYPLFVPCIVLCAVFALAAVALRQLRDRRPGRAELALAAGRLLGVVALGAALSPVAFARNARYWISILDGSFPLGATPPYVLPINVLPGWVLQTRDFYGLTNLLHHAGPAVLLAGGLGPLLLIAVIAFAASRYRIAALMVGLGVAASVLAYYSWASENCTYCVQRNLIALGALAPMAIALGIAAVAAARPRFATTLAVLVAGATLVLVGHESIVEHQRLSNGDYILGRQDRQAAARIPAHAGPIELEGFGEGPGPQPPMELPLVYNLIDERTHDVSLPTITDDGHGLAYLTGGPIPLGPSFRVNYQYVLTRLAGIATQRRQVAHYGPIALERRNRDLDVTLVSGVSVATADQDPSGRAWVSGVLRFLVVGGRPGEPAWISLSVRHTVPVSLPAQAEVSDNGDRAGVLRICARASGLAPLRYAAVGIAFTPQLAPPPRQAYAQPLPARGAELAQMSVSITSCATRP